MTTSVTSVTRARRFSARRVRMLARAKKHIDENLDAVLLTHPVSLWYYAGCREGATALLVGRGRTVVLTNRMFGDRVRMDAAGCEVRVVSGNPWEAVARILDARGIRRLGYEDDHVTVRRFEQWKKTLNGIEFAGIGNTAALCRCLKDDEELSILRRAVRIAEDAFQSLRSRGAGWFIGRTEKEIAAELVAEMLRHGADREAFPTIVASGPNSYFCHHTPTERRVRRNEPLLFDWGAEVDGYRSDITRVLFTGAPPEPLERVYSLVLKAHDAAVAAMRPGIAFKSVERIARQIIARAGHGPAFRHGLGHSLGLEIHEPPTFSGDPTMPRLRRNLVITVEPGVYLKNLGGVRIEDDVLVTPDGAERLNALPRSLDFAILD